MPWVAVSEIQGWVRDSTAFWWISILHCSTLRFLNLAMFNLALFKSCTVAKFLNFQSPPAVRFNPRCNLLARQISQMLITAEFWHFSAFNRWLGPMMCRWTGTLNISHIATEVGFYGAFCTGPHNMWDVDCKSDDKISVALQTWNNVGFYVFCATWPQSIVLTIYDI